MSCSDTTYLKQFYFLQAFKEFAYQNQQQDIFAVDMNGYQGEYEYDGKTILGSSIVMDVIADRFKCNLKGVVYEQEQTNFNKLQASLLKYQVTALQALNCSNEQVQIVPFPQCRTFLYYDPNNIKAEQIRYITAIAEKHSQVDLLLYVGAATLKRAVVHFRHPRPFELLDPLIATRDNAYISDTYSSHRQWFLLLLTNQEYNLPRYCRLTDPLGTLLRTQLDHTKEEIDTLWHA